MEDNKDQNGAAVRGEAVAESHDFTTHRDAWRDAITTMINDEAKACNHDQADYWRHELKAYDRAFAILLDAPVSARAADALDSQPSITAKLKKWEAYAFSTSLDERNDDLCQMIDELMALDSQPTVAAQQGSIGDDARFRELLALYRSSKLGERNESREALTSYINSRASAAPVVNMVPSMIVTNTPNQVIGCDWDSIPDGVYYVYPAPQQEGSEAGNG